LTDKCKCSGEIARREREIEGLFEKLKDDYHDPEVLRAKLSQQFCLTRDMKIYKIRGPVPG